MGWLHDCVVSSVVYEPIDQDTPSLSLHVECPGDLGYPPWEGKKLHIVASGLAMLKLVGWGVCGPDSINSVRAGVSAEARESTTEARRHATSFPSVEFTVALNSGAYIECICEHVRCEVKS
jgi:hypothetical protein